MASLSTISPCRKTGAFVLTSLLMAAFSGFSFQIDADEPKNPTRAHVRSALARLYVDRDMAAATLHFEAALRKNPGDYEANLFFGMAFMTYSQPVNPKKAAWHFKKAQAWKKTSFNTRLLALALEKEKGREAAMPLYEESARMALAKEDGDVEITKFDLEFGRRQLLAMLEDRPEMKAYVREGDWLWNWALEKFAGKGLRTQVLWFPSDPDLHTDAMSGDMADWDGRMLLQIRKNPLQYGANGNNYWSSFVFEMLNNDWRERNTWIWMRARGLNATADQYGLALRVLEAGTAGEVHEFYFSRWIPHCKKYGLPHEAGPWSINESSSPFLEDWVFNYLGGKDRVYDKALSQE